MNKAMLIGNLGADPEIRVLNNGQRVANMRIATSERWTDKQTGEKKERTEWHTVTVFNDALVGIIEKYVRKGSKVYIEGKLQTRKWQDQQGNDRYSTEITLQNFGGMLELLGDGNGGGRREERSDDEPRGDSRRGDNQSSRAKPEIDDEIPF